MATRVTEGARRQRHEKKRDSFLSSRSAALVSRVSLNLKKKRDCSQSTYWIGVDTLPNSFSCRHEELSGSLRASSRFTRPNRRAYSCSQASYL